MSQKNILPSYIVPKVLWIALAFGIMAYIPVRLGLTIPIPGMNLVTDPREIIVTLGAALTGPVGGMLIGIFAGAYDPYGLAWIGIINHILAGIWVGWAYKSLIYGRLKIPWVMLGWMGVLLVDYYVIMLPMTTLLIYLIPNIQEQAGLTGIRPSEAYFLFVSSALPELLVTFLITSLCWMALPRRYRKPLW
jgi:hypothetical protein